MDKKRGMIENIKKETAEKYEALTGEKFNQATIRLLPYLYYTALDQQPVDRKKISGVEKELLVIWTDKKLCSCYPFFEPVRFTNKDFYNLVCEILYEGYILNSEDENPEQ